MNTARAIAQRSLCSRDRVGAVIVSVENRIIDTGYNGPPAKWMPIHSDSCVVWCPRAAMQYWMHNSTGAADCPSIVDENAFYGPQPDYSDCPSLHAEANALMFGDRAQRVGGTIYVSSTVCGGCAKLIANSGLAHVVYTPGENVEHRDPDRWIAFMIECGLEVRAYDFV